MRQFLFRGKTEKGEWVYGLLVHIGNAWYILNEAKASAAYEVIPNTIGQYTGLTDRTAKKIFEGDIVNHNMIKELVVFRDGSFGLFSNGTAIHLMVANKRVEVTGNIHDNPELLEHPK